MRNPLPENSKLAETKKPRQSFGKITVGFQGIDSEGRGDFRITQMPYETPYEKLAPIIETSLNNHQALLDFCRQVISWYEEAGNEDPNQKSVGSVELWVMAKKAIKNAEAPNE